MSIAYAKDNLSGKCVVCGKKAKKAGGKTKRNWTLQTCGRSDCVKHARLHAWKYEQTVDTNRLMVNILNGLERDRLLAIRDKFSHGRR